MSSTNGGVDDREIGADASSNPIDTAPGSETEDTFDDQHITPATAMADTTATSTTTPEPNSMSPQIISQSPGADYPHNHHPNNHNINNNTNQSSAFMRQHGYYAQAYQQQSNPPPNSPAPSALAYDPSSAILQHLGSGGGDGNSFGIQQFPPPLSPGLPNGCGNTTNNNNAGTDDANISLGVLAPSSPVFPNNASMAFMGTNSEQQQQQHMDSSRMTGGGSLISPPSPSMQYISAHPPSPVVSAYAGPYSYGSPGVNYASPSIRDVGSPSGDRGNWTDRAVYQSTPQSTNSPHIQSQPIPMQFQTGIRTTSFDEMLPGPALDDNGSYSTTNTINGATPNMFSQQQQAQWAQYSLTNLPYSPSSQQQPQIQGHHHPSQPPVVGHPRPVPGQHGRSPQVGGVTGAAGYYPATTPGPPIQTTHHNKGPDGANLFIFHIPNHFTNLDMWHLFCHYGNLLSVRIMVEKDTGRSRGFGFVSYDSPDAAAMAIKELNGFVIGNKRLKVQHKQIRPSENNHQASQQDNLQSPPLFPQMNSASNVPTIADAGGESSGNIHMYDSSGNIHTLKSSFFEDSHHRNETMTPDMMAQQATNHQNNTVESGQQQHLPNSGDDAVIASEIKTQNNDGQSDVNSNNNSNNLKRHYDDRTGQNVGSSMGNMDQMRDALPDVTK